MLKVKASARSLRVSDLLHKELAKIIHTEFKNPNLGMVTISEVATSNNLAFAKVFVTVLEDDKRIESINILNKAVGFFRCRLAKQLMLRIVPDLKFVFDNSLINGNRLDHLISIINNQDN